MSVPVHVTPETKDDIQSGLRYLDRQQHGLGTRFVDEVLRALDRPGEMPLGSGEIELGIRAVGVPRFGYVIYYRTDGSRVEVLAVLQGAVSPEVWKRRMRRARRTSETPDFSQPGNFFAVQKPR